MQREPALRRTRSARARVPSMACAPNESANAVRASEAGVHGPAGDCRTRAGRDVYRLYWNPNCFWLARPEGDDAPNRIVRRNADRYAISGNHLDSEAAHSAAELGEHFVSGVALHTV